MGFIMYQTYTIGELAKMLGITAETIRYYERKGIIQPIHDENTGYRYYTTWDLHMMIRARCYLGFGFTIEQTVKMLQKSNLDDINDVLFEQELLIEKQIVYYMNLLKQIRINRSLIEDFQNQSVQLSIKKNPAMFRINTQTNYHLILSKQQQIEIKSMSEKIPFVFSTALFKKNNILNNNTEFDFGIGIGEQFARLLNIQETGYIHYYPSQLCLYMCVPSRSSQFLTSQIMQPAFDYMKENNLELNGDIITQIIAMYKPGDEYFNWHNVWIPIK